MREDFINIRKFFYLDNEYDKSIECQAVTDLSPRFSFELDPEERRWCISFWLPFFQFYINFWMPKWAFLKRVNCRDKDGNFDVGSREVSISFHNWGIWWKIWKDGMSWSNKEPWWRDGCFTIDNIRGKMECTTTEVETSWHQGALVEGIYDLQVTKELYRRHYPRWFGWFDDKFHRYEVTPYMTVDGNREKTCVPHPGKGENSWDCGMGGTWNNSIPDCLCNDSAQGAVAEFIKSELETRTKRTGRADWKPERMGHLALEVREASPTVGGVGENKPSAKCDKDEG